MENNSTNTSDNLGLWTKSLLLSNILNVSLGIPLNLLVLGLIAGGLLVKGSEIIALNQTLCELALCIENITTILYHYIPNALLRSVIMFLFGLEISGRLMFMTVVCVNIYLAVSHPVAFLRFKPRRIKVAVCGACWLVVLATCVTTFFADPNELAIAAFTGTAASILVQLTCGVLILRRLIQPRPGARKAGSVGMNGAKLRAFAIIATLLVSTLFNFLPLCVVTGMSQALTYSEYLHLGTIASYFKVFGGLINPLLWVCRAERLPCIRAKQEP